MKTTTSPIIVIALGLIFGLLLVIYAKIPTPVECGICGANVYESWSVSNMDNTALVTVCGKCYDEFRESN